MTASSLCSLPMSDPNMIETDADIEAELASWTLPPAWNPAHQGRCYIYKPVDKHEVARIEALMRELPEHHAKQVQALWRQLTAARYTTELM